ncbi:MAG: DUF1127 domain-containing protein [Rhodobacterales bacterium]|nr:DUF1127 domain-containing protein [Rhodobacterales bacterium]
MSAFRLALPLIAHLRLAAVAALRFPARVLSAAAMSRSRRALAQLDERLLRDVGLTLPEALTEAKRPAWDAPRHWQG